MFLLATTTICVAVFLYIGVPLIYGHWLRLLLKLRTAKLRSLVLTFDGGPSNRSTRAILELLAENNTKATFFLLGKHISGQEDIVRQIAEQGHEICSHGYDHLHYWKVSCLRALDDIRRGWRAIDMALGTERHTYPFRPPYGRLSIVCLLYLLIRRVPIIYWTLDVGDTWPVNKQDIGRIALAKKAGGAVFLAHDFERADVRRHYFVLESLRTALLMAKETGMDVVTVSEFLRNRKR